MTVVAVHVAVAAVVSAETVATAYAGDLVVVVVRVLSVDAVFGAVGGFLARWAWLRAFDALRARLLWIEVGSELGDCRRQPSAAGSLIAAVDVVAVARGTPVARCYGPVTVALSVAVCYLLVSYSLAAYQPWELV